MKKILFALNLLGCLLILPSVCSAQFITHYSTYHSESVASDGVTATFSATVDGYTQVPPEMPTNGVLHTPYVYISLDGSQNGGPGTGKCPTCYISETYTTSEQFIPGNLINYDDSFEVNCSVAGFFFRTSSSGNLASFTPVQHNYPMTPLAGYCWISQFFDHVTNGKAHRAQDVVYSNSTDNGGIVTGYGSAVFAAEGGTVVSEAKGNGPSAQAYPACAGQGVPANYVKIKGSDGYFTVYVHVTPVVNVGDPIYAGQQIGVTDNSGCQSGSHIHMRRTDPSGTPVNFTIPCVNSLPKNSFWDGLVNDDDPDNI